MKRIIDLTLQIHAEMPAIPVGHRRPKLEKYSLQTYPQDYPPERVPIQWELHIDTHAGTHIDAPVYPMPMYGKGVTVDQIPPDHLYGTGVVVHTPKGVLEKITAKDLEKAEPKIRKGDIVFIETGWERKWGIQPDEYLQSYRPGLTTDAAEWLVKKKVKVIGADLLHIQHPEVNEFDPKTSVHEMLRSNNLVIVEGLTNLDEVAGKRLKLGIFPLPIKGAHGAPARVVAFVE